MTNSNYKSRDELLTNQNAPLIFERDVQSNSLEDLVHALHESNHGRNKGNPLDIENWPKNNFKKSGWPKFNNHVIKGIKLICFIIDINI